MIREIVTDKDALSQVAEPATADDAAVGQDLKDTMLSIEGCACLAANQIGSTKAVVAYEENGVIHVMYNPKILAGMQPYTTVEGCLSHEDPSEVRRFQTVRVSFQVLGGGELQQRTKRFSGWTAEIIQHGIDHCAGKLV